MGTSQDCVNILLVAGSLQQLSSGKSARGAAAGVFVYMGTQDAMVKTVWLKWRSDNSAMETQLCVFSDVMKHLI